jgi:hypothetical protein
VIIEIIFNKILSFLFLRQTGATECTRVEKSTWNQVRQHILNFKVETILCDISSVAGYTNHQQVTKSLHNSNLNRRCYSVFHTFHISSSKITEKNKKIHRHLNVQYYEHHFINITNILLTTHNNFMYLCKYIRTQALENDYHQPSRATIAVINSMLSFIKEKNEMFSFFLII